MFLKYFLKHKSPNVNSILKHIFLLYGNQCARPPKNVKGNCFPITLKQCKPFKCHQQCYCPLRGKSVRCIPTYPYPPVKHICYTSPTFPPPCCLSNVASKKWFHPYAASISSQCSLPRHSPQNYSLPKYSSQTSFLPKNWPQQPLLSGFPPDCCWPGFCECPICSCCQCYGPYKKPDSSQCSNKCKKTSYVLSNSIPYNPCCPNKHKGHNTYQKYRSIFFMTLPIITIFSLYIMGCETAHKETCRDYEFMRRRTKRFPWGEGNKSLYHNDETNFLPEECVSPPDDDECKN
ncbi:uncharacterized protein LOC113232497 [Hyposmocoma kahamanoa]|uniref:uncharacterized protein LOC113232497 n=1 Tax=Hyposmocoma kahamanoa TaxID=1477025 RepID=UPI000E6D6872|nr:uncharacterized protein LOC113232497 [Hyposmocoma kahamanoa]